MSEAIKLLSSAISLAEQPAGSTLAREHALIMVLLLFMVRRAIGASVRLEVVVIPVARVPAE